MRTLIVAAALSATALAAAAQAGQSSPPAAPPAPRASIAGPDGVISRAEALAQADRMFAMLDTDRNGSVSKAEMTAARERMRAMRAAGRDGTPPPLPPPGAGAPQPGTDMAPHGPRGPGMRGGHRGGGMGARMFDRADSNDDGQVTRDEFRAAAQARFDMRDTNDDGRIDLNDGGFGRGKRR